MTVFLSEAIGADRLPFVPDRSENTARSRRWTRLASLYRQGLVACGFSVTSILRPEIYQTGVALGARHVGPGDWHIAIKPLEHLRPFHGLPNVFVCDWGYPMLSRSSGPGAPFLNHVRVLGVADIVACCTEATTRVVKQAGLHNVVHLPPFIADLKTFVAAPRRTSTSADCVYLSLMDTDDPIHTWASLLQGFALARRRNERLRLSVIVDGSADVQQWRDVMLTRFALDDLGDSVSFTAVSHEDMIARMSPQADYFIDVAPPGGFPLSSIQALQSGLPLIAAQGDWLGLPKDAYIPVTTFRRDGAVSEEPAASVMHLQSDWPDALSVCEALLAAATLTPAARQALGKATQKFTEERFGLDAFRTALHQTLGLLQGPMS